MKEIRPSHRSGKISEHSHGAGVPSPQDVEERARELAIIAGRAASDFNQSDLQQAKTELLGTSSVEDEESVAAVTTWDEVPGSTGKQAKNYGPRDESNVAQELVESGAEEALHDELLEARKKNIDAAS